MCKLLKFIKFINLIESTASGRCGWSAGHTRRGEGPGPDSDRSQGGAGLSALASRRHHAGEDQVRATGEIDRVLDQPCPTNDRRRPSAVSRQLSVVHNQVSSPSTSAVEPHGGWTRPYVSTILPLAALAFFRFTTPAPWSRVRARLAFAAPQPAFRCRSALLSRLGCSW
jgi:hypothetical protein